MTSGACWRLQSGVGMKLEFHVTCKAVWAAEELGGCETKGGSGRWWLGGSAGPWEQCTAWDLVIWVLTVRLSQEFLAVENLGSYAHKKSSSLGLWLLLSSTCKSIKAVETSQYFDPQLRSHKHTLDLHHSSGLETAKSFKTLWSYKHI